MEKTMEAYINDMLVKLNSCEDHLVHLRQAFPLMILHHLWLNPNKCAFGVESENFLEFLVSRRGIKMGLEQAKAIMQMHPLITKKQI